MGVPSIVGQSAEARFRDLYDKNYAAICGFALRRVSNAEAADVVAETFLVAWRRLEAIPVGSERLWLYAVARRVVANQRRGLNRRMKLAAALQFEFDATVVTDSAESDYPTIAGALKRLRESDRQVLSLAAWEGLGPEELGKVLGCSPGAAKVRLHRARRRFREELEALESSDEAIVRGSGGRASTSAATSTED